MIEEFQSMIGSTSEQYGPLIMVVAVTITDSVPLMPTQPLSILAGGVFGLRIGLPAVIIGQTMATALALVVGRYVLKRRRRGQQLEQQQQRCCRYCFEDNDHDHDGEWQRLLMLSPSTAATTEDDEGYNDNNQQGDEQPPQDNNNNKKKKTQNEDNNNNNKLVKVLDEMTSGLNSDDWKMVFGTILIARQSPILPFSLGNYFVGASTSAPILLTVVATVVGCLPFNVFWVGAGAGGTAALKQAITTIHGGGGAGAGDDGGGGRAAAAESGGVAQKGSSNNDNNNNNNNILLSMAEGGLEVIGLLATIAIVLFMVKVILKVYKGEEEKKEEEKPLLSS